MECTGKKLGIYINSGKKKIKKVCEELSCKAAVNGGLFDMKTFKPVAQLKANGHVYANENWGINWGLAWNDDNVKMDCDLSTYKNFIGCICIVKDGKAVNISYPAEMGGSRRRTAAGILKNGDKWLFASDYNMTPEVLQGLALDRGCVSAIMCDCGTSTQGVFPNGNVVSSRIVHNILYVTDGVKVCPYTEPAANIRRMSIGEGAKWVQWMLNQRGYTLDVDGIFGNKSVAALTDFQRKNGLTADGICGKMTRTVLKGE